MEQQNKTDGTSNYNRGFEWEMKCLSELHKRGLKFTGSTRMWNKDLDSKGVDICGVIQEEEFPYYISCKATSSLVNYPQLLDNLPRQEGIINTIFHRKYFKNEIKAEVAIIDIRDFYTLIKQGDK